MNDSPTARPPSNLPIIIAAKLVQHIRITQDSKNVNPPPRSIIFLPMKGIMMVLTMGPRAPPTADNALIHDPSSSGR